MQNKRFGSSMSILSITLFVQVPHFTLSNDIQFLGYAPSNLTSPPPVDAVHLQVGAFVRCEVGGGFMRWGCRVLFVLLLHLSSCRVSFHRVQTLEWRIADFSRLGKHRRGVATEHTEFAEKNSATSVANFSWRLGGEKSVMRRADGGV